LIIG
jgi:hypothetical protein